LIIHGLRVPPLGRRLRGINKEGYRAEFIKRFGKPIEEYETFKRAIEGTRGTTPINYTRELTQYFLFIDEDPDTVIATRKKDLFGDDILNNERYERKTKTYIMERESKNLSINGVLGRIQGFYTNNSRKLSLDFGKKLKYSKARKKQKYSPSNVDVRDLIANAQLKRDCFIISVMYQHGLDPVDFSDWRIGDYPTEPWNYKEFSRSKTGEICRIISTPDTCLFLKEYLVVRRGNVGESLFWSRGEQPLTNAGVSDAVRAVMIKAGKHQIKGFKPTSLRDAFEDALSDARTYPKTKKALMGHMTGDIQFEYGGHDKMIMVLTEAMKTVYPFIALSDISNAELAGLSADDMVKVKQLLERADEITLIYSALKSGHLVHVKDPELDDKKKD